MPSPASPSRRYLSLWLPLLPTDRLLRRHGPPARRPLAVRRLRRRSPLVAKSASAMRLAAVDRTAMRRGLDARHGAVAGTRRAPDLAVAPHDADADAQLLEAIADWADRYTPLVGRNAPDGLMLDITGAAHLHGGEAPCRPISRPASAARASPSAPPSPPRPAPLSPSRATAERRRSSPTTRFARGLGATPHRRPAPRSRDGREPRPHGPENHRRSHDPPARAARRPLRRAARCTASTRRSASIARPSRRAGPCRRPRSSCASSSRSCARRTCRRRRGGSPCRSVRDLSSAARARGRWC